MSNQSQDPAVCPVATSSLGTTSNTDTEQKPTGEIPSPPSIPTDSTKNAKEYLRKLIFSPTRLTISDGRVITGIITCYYGNPVEDWHKILNDIPLILFNCLIAIRINSCS